MFDLGAKNLNNNNKNPKIPTKRHPGKINQKGFALISLPDLLYVITNVFSSTLPSVLADLL